MKKMFLVLITLIIVGICIPAVSAEIVINEELNVSIDTSVSGTNEYTGSGGATTPSMQSTSLAFDNIENHKDLSYIGMEFSGNMTPTLNNGENEVTYTLNGVTKPCIVYISRYTNILGQVTKTKILIFPQNWDIDNLQGYKTVKFSFPFGNGLGYYNGVVSQPVPIYLIPDYYPTGGFKINGYYAIASTSVWKNNLTVNTTSYPEGYDVSLERIVDGHEYASTINITKDNNLVINHHSDNEPYLGWFSKNDIDTIEITNSLDKNFIFKLDNQGSDDPNNPGDPGDPGAPVTVYILNSQTGAAIANSRCIIDALVDGDYYPVVNRTEPSGIFSVTLQPTGGGMPNPDGYRLIASADGYINQVPEINFTVDEYVTSIYCSLDPIAGGPVDENNTFIDFFVRDTSANPIKGATVNFGGYTLITNSAGYAVLEVSKNATYTYTVSKSGYGSLTGNAVIGSDARHTINTVIAPAVTPTTPTAIPTSTPVSPTPTMTAPTGESVSNLLEWFAAHFGMVLGGGVEIGKIFMWLCFSVPVGVYVGKEAKAGAAGFMAGAGIVTLFFVLIGWVPIWLLVLLALIIGLLYAKVFNNSDTGGGR